MDFTDPRPRAAGLALAVGEGDGGEAVDRLDEYETLLRAVTQLLDDVDRALATLDQGTYGVCEVCGTTLDDGHLGEDPLVTRCAQHRAVRGD
ncbi:MAG TPA: hypothetical protein VMD28_09970 [Acidimicrobiales bacterium]|nr:hypothetical protein [Acidimicrobiales bacterium]